jgi:hypothetical protein
MFCARVVNGDKKINLKINSSGSTGEVKISGETR